MTARFAIHPEDFKSYGTEKIREHFLIPKIFTDDELTLCYTHYDRLIIGGAKPLSKSILLSCPENLKAEFFLQRRELGIINVGNPGIVIVDGESYELNNREALYIAKDSRVVEFKSGKNGGSLFYFNSAPAHTKHPTRKITLSECESTELGAIETANKRIVRKIMINSVVKTCQLQMGFTEIQTGSVWNTMPPHVHDRRMEAYFYFDIPANQRVCHFLGQPQDTRHIWIDNHQAVLSPPWSIHAGAGTSNYTFVWGMAGENLDYSDMDAVKISELL
jgi:4-deoxy-L-threo-5-hexosulose-uronate ketol-isomerase